MLEDGVYDVIVVDATEAEGALALELAVLAGPYKGEIVRVRARELPIDPLDALGVPGTLTVADGEPHVTLEST